ncbi:hypothetical protein BATDEDRAFT_26515 [Batrachochytrium dendrobatidis JAM81]|uniref:RanBP2-type domain-containing protein n=2 Tax=Batrachochytrium dendrobatidis TaxID=109871 RepID=F4P7Y2_BATDJ|nr:uncharacterized protein BATDEDRAFT_26515 [Batrachochytrium dendrobatidis JAM81]EGF78469.1 hypothetical protein BATDEDRAFT_26515 [Batrachochytrium dendrobatidis JAM81]KAJ8324117.1 Asparagine-rich protein (ARP protein) [Batrachochytrium dendrobatidis]KAK5664911.1 Asparagine-rich protein (ARP protein) [Batrachochytrium dendrobatidis]OAJ43505.1 hypothetical protein BDEG_26860 [Batrachochytrium dendrobatidis JEL423]|eukprot:XP_006680688.1 hypothetical protein BATDEDRAFT_26515 [Batrachochytrium dendrobatidis JAM81]
MADNPNQFNLQQLQQLQQQQMYYYNQQYQQPFTQQSYQQPYHAGNGVQYGQQPHRNNDVRPGDWNCSECNSHNFASRTACFRCKAVKPGGGASGYGGNESATTQPNYYNNQYQDQHDQHRHPHQHRHSNMHQHKPYDRQHPTKGRMLAGDWICQMCQKHNFASRQQCFQCGANGAGAVRHVDRPGDWKCSSCTYLNFASRTACYKCQAQKLTDLEYPAGSPSAGAPANGAVTWDSVATNWTAPPGATGVSSLPAIGTGAAPAHYATMFSSNNDPAGSSAANRPEEDAPLAAAADAAWQALAPVKSVRPATFIQSTTTCINPPSLSSNIFSQLTIPAQESQDLAEDAGEDTQDQEVHDEYDPNEHEAYDPSEPAGLLAVLDAPIPDYDEREEADEEYTPEIPTQDEEYTPEIPTQDEEPYEP